MNFYIENLTKYYDKKLVLDDINFSFESGKIYGLLGRNGSGKTTLFNCINKDIKFDSGNFYIGDDENRNLFNLDNISYVLSTPTVPEFLTAYEFLKFFIDMNKEKIRDLKSIDEYFELVKIADEDKHKLLKDYSHGMKNKIQMLTSMITDSKLILLDEPLTSLDVVVAEEIKQLFRKIKKDKVIILSTHILDLALDLCDEIVLLQRGKLEELNCNKLNNENYKNTIIESLKNEENI